MSLFGNALLALLTGDVSGAARQRGRCVAAPSASSLHGTQAAYALVRDGLAVWRLTTMLVNEDGPSMMFHRLRTWSGIHGDDGSALKYTTNDVTPLMCTYCTSVWVAAVLWLTPVWFRGFLALSGVSVFIDKQLERRC